MDPVTDPGSPGYWQQHIPQELAAEKVWEPLKEKPIQEVLKQYVSGQKMIGSAVHLPKEDAKPEEIEAFYNKLGRPAKVEEYKIQKPALAEGMIYSPEKEKEFLAIAHKAGLTTKQAQAMIDFQGKMIEGQLQSFARQRQEREEGLKKEWGTDFDRRKTLAERGFEFIIEDAKIQPEEAEKLFKEANLYFHPVFMKIFHRIGEMLAEDGWIKSEGTQTLKDSAKEKIDAIMKDPKHPYWNDGPGHKEALEEWKLLHKQAFG